MINILDKQTADKIAAGEVIERPVSIVKELVENSIDAGADKIVLEIKEGGKSYIRVTDNGSGIDRYEVEKAFLRHATSKITTAKDLEAIETLGFRGEALASICAVTRTEVLTKTKEENVGTRLVIHGGEIIKKERAGTPDGTTFVVTDLFYNTPGRFKFLKADSTEAGLIANLMSEFALMYANISFRFINNGNIIFSTRGDGNRLSIIANVFSNIRVEDLVPVNYEDSEITVSGYISTPAFSRPTRSGQVFFVNGRVVSSKVIDRGISIGYKERLFEGRNPICYLFLDVKPSEIDVNIHPNKKEVRFDDEKTVELVVGNAIFDALGTKEAVTRAGNIFKIEDKNIMSTNIEEQTFANLKSDVSEEKFNFYNVPKDEAKKYEAPPKKTDDFSDYKANLKAYEKPEKPYISIDSPVLKPFNFDDLNVKSSIFDTYILAVDNDNFYIIDQHAAHERIFYEKLVSQFEKEEVDKQTILAPIILDLNVSDKISSDKWMELLRNMGFAIENFGQNSFRITEIPMFMELGEARDFVKDFVDQVTDTFDPKNTVIINKLITKSCKSAVKANDHLSDEEIKELISELKLCKNPFSCPHGRPTFIKMSKYEIEKLFKRV